MIDHNFADTINFSDGNNILEDAMYYMCSSTVVTFITKNSPQMVRCGLNKNQQGQFELALRSNQDVGIIAQYLKMDPSLAETKIYQSTNYHIRQKDTLNCKLDETYYYLQCYLWSCRGFEYDLDKEYASYVNNMVNVTQLLYNQYNPAGLYRSQKSGMNCLHIALAANRHRNVVEMVYNWDRTMLTENTTDEGHTPLHYAIQNRDGGMGTNAHETNQRPAFFVHREEARVHTNTRNRMHPHVRMYQRPQELFRKHQQVALGMAQTYM